MGVFFALPIGMNKSPACADVRFRAALSSNGKLKLRTSTQKHTVETISGDDSFVFVTQLVPVRRKPRRSWFEMKKLMSVLAGATLSAVAIGGGWQPEPMELPGKFDGMILQITADGMRIEGVFHRDINGGNPDFGGEFFLKGYAGSAADGQAISSVPSLPAGFYTYTTVLGAERTIRALRYTTESYRAP
jgi:hypothetical protein